MAICASEENWLQVETGRRRGRVKQNAKTECYNLQILIYVFLIFNHFTG